MKYFIFSSISIITILYLFFRVFFLENKKNYPVAGAVLTIVYCFFASMKDGGPDFIEYEKMYDSMRSMTSDDGLRIKDAISIGKDLNFSIWLYLNSLLDIGFSYVILFSAFLSLNIKRVAWRNLDLDPSVAISVWFFTYYFILDLTQIRAAIAVAFCFIALAYLLRGGCEKYFIFILIAIGFHAQAGIFLLCSLPLLLKDSLNFNFKLKLIVIFSFLYALTISVFFKYYAEIDSRPGILNVSSEFPLNGIVASLINFSFLFFLFRASLKSVTSEIHLKIAKLSFVFVIVGFLFLILNLYSSSALAWRSYEMFNCFGVFLVTVVLTKSKNNFYKLCAILYILFNFVLNLRASLVFY